jgi:hypothetical protein
VERGARGETSTSTYRLPLFLTPPPPAEGAGPSCTLHPTPGPVDLPGRRRLRQLDFNFNRPGRRHCRRPRRPGARPSSPPSAWRRGWVRSRRRAGLPVRCPPPSPPSFLRLRLPSFLPPPCSLLPHAPHHPPPITPHYPSTPQVRGPQDHLLPAGPADPRHLRGGPGRQQGPPGSGRATGGSRAGMALRQVGTVGAELGWH